MRKLLVMVALLLGSSVSIAEPIELEKRDYLTIIVSNYVHGFKEFDTSVVTFDDSINVGIYYNSNKQNFDRAEQLAARFKEFLPSMLEAYDWASDISIVVNVYGEDRSRGW